MLTSLYLQKHSDFMDSSLLILLVLLSSVAFLYSSVGHGGASGYLAVMALMGIAPALMKSSALVMNLAVSLFSFIGFYRAGHFKLKLFWPFALASIPMSFLGAMHVLPDSIYKKILAVCILISIARMLFQFEKSDEPNKPIPLAGALGTGGVIGLISGMIGIGGGILLSPVMLLMRWSKIKETAAVSALFIFVNSVAGLIGALSKGTLQVSQHLLWAVLATVLGGILGSYFGSHRFNVPTLRYLLALGLGIACLKLLFT